MNAAFRHSVSVTAIVAALMLATAGAGSSATRPAVGPAVGSSPSGFATGVINAPPYYDAAPGPYGTDYNYTPSPGYGPGYFDYETPDSSWSYQPANPSGCNGPEPRC
jgi:hypothetical protein